MPIKTFLFSLILLSEIAIAQNTQLQRIDFDLRTFKVVQTLNDRVIPALRAQPNAIDCNCITTNDLLNAARAPGVRTRRAPIQPMDESLIPQAVERNQWGDKVTRWSLPDGTEFSAQRARNLGRRQYSVNVGLAREQSQHGARLDWHMACGKKKFGTTPLSDTRTGCSTGVTYSQSFGGNN